MPGANVGWLGHPPSPRPEPSETCSSPRRWTLDPTSLAGSCCCVLCRCIRPCTQCPLPPPRTASARLPEALEPWPHPACVHIRLPAVNQAVAGIPQMHQAAMIQTLHIKHRAGYLLDGGAPKDREPTLFKLAAHCSQLGPGLEAAALRKRRGHPHHRVVVAPVAPRSSHFRTSRVHTRITDS
eukprot:1340137-Rhodomonas_salina.3